MLETFKSMLVLMDKEEKLGLYGLLKAELEMESLDVLLEPLAVETPPPKAARRGWAGAPPIWVKHVVSLDGGKNGAYDIAGDWVKWSELPEREGFFVACPKGAGKRYYVLTYDAGGATTVDLEGGRTVVVRNALCRFVSDSWEEVREALLEWGVQQGV
jgi:hypothetical protein